MECTAGFSDISDSHVFSDSDKNADVQISVVVLRIRRQFRDVCASEKIL